MTFMRQGGTIEIEFWLDIGAMLASQANNLIRYRLAVREDEKHGVGVADESLRQYAKSWFPAGKPFEVSEKVKPKRLLGKTAKGTDFYTREVGKYQDSFNFGLNKLTLATTPPDEERYPTANTVRRFLMQSVRYLQLNSRAMRAPCPATRPTDLDLDGSNLARVVGRFYAAGNGNHKAGDPVHYSDTFCALYPPSRNPRCCWRRIPRWSSSRLARTLCCVFPNDFDGTHIHPASQHPALAEWDGTPDLATIFAMGLLG